MFQRKERRDHKVFKSKFASFISTLVLDMNNHEEDLELFKRLLGWVLALSSCQYRPFRITATFCGLYVQENLCKLIVHNYVDLESNHVSISHFSSLLDFIFNGLYLHRYRDVDPYIRATCVSHLTEWIIVYPKKFLDNSYLRYIGWILSDKAPEARTEATNAIITLLESNEKDVIFSGIRSFLDRFLPRIVECASRDRDNTVQDASLLLLYKLSFHELIDAEVLDNIFFIFFSNNRQAKTLFIKILNTLLSKKKQPLHIVKFQLLFSIAEWFFKKLHRPFSYLTKDLFSTIALNFMQCYQTADETQNISSKDIISFLCIDFPTDWANDVDTNLDGIRQILLYFVSGIYQSTQASTFMEISSNLILNWKSIFSNIHSTPTFKENIFSIVHPIVINAPISPICEADSKKWLLSISEIFSNAQMVFLNVAPSVMDTTILENSTISTVLRFIIFAFGMGNLLVEKRNLLLSLYSHLEEDLFNNSVTTRPQEEYFDKNHLTKSCIIIIKLQCLYNELSISCSPLFDEIKRYVVGHFESISNEYNVLLSSLRDYSSDLTVLTFFNHISIYLFSILKLMPLNGKIPELIYSIIDSSAAYGIVTKNLPSPLFLSLYTDTLLFALNNGLAMVTNLNRSPLDCMESLISKNLRALSELKVSAISTNFSEFVDQVGSDLKLIHSGEYLNVKCYLKLLFIELIDQKILKLLLQLHENLPNPVILLFRSYFNAFPQMLFPTHIIQTLVEGFLDVCNMGSSSIDRMQRLNDFLCSIFSPSSNQGKNAQVPSQVLENFTIALVSAFSTQYSKGEHVNFYVFKFINEIWAKNISPKVSYDLNAKIESVSPEKSTPFLEHFIQFKKYINRTSLSFKINRSNNVSSSNLIRTSMDFDPPPPAISTFTDSAGLNFKTTEWMEINTTQNNDERSIEFPTSPEMY